MVLDEPKADDEIFKESGLTYAIEKKELLGKRVDDTIMLSGSNYKIVAISKDEVVVSDPDTKKRFLIPTLSAR